MFVIIFALIKDKNHNRLNEIHKKQNQRTGVVLVLFASSIVRSLILCVLKTEIFFFKITSNIVQKRQTPVKNP